MNAFQPKRILAVDDNTWVLRLIELELQPEGFEVIKAHSAEMAIAWCEENGAPDLLLTDIQLPGLDGRTLYLWLNTRFPRVQVIFITANTDSAGILDAPILEKPYFRHQLLSTVKFLA